MLDFESWLRLHGPFDLSSQPVCIGPSLLLGAGQCLVATRALKRGDVVLTVPRTLIVSSAHQRIVECPHQLALRKSDWHDSAANVVELALTLLIERLKGRESFFAPYIDAVLAPLQFTDHLSQWTDEQLAWLSFADAAAVADEASFAHRLHANLAETHLDAQQKRLEALWITAWRDFVCPFLCERQLLAEPDAAQNYALFVWALCTVWSRGYWVGGVPCLVPVADMANHLGRGLAFFGSVADLLESGTVSEADVASARASPANADDDQFFNCGAFRLVTNRDVAAGDEVFISYGCDNRSSLADYGFVLTQAEDADLDVAVAAAFPHFAAARFSSVQMSMCVSAEPVWPEALNADGDAFSDVWTLACEPGRLPGALMRSLRFAMWVSERVDDDDDDDEDEVRQKLSDDTALSAHNERRVLEHLDRQLQTWLDVFVELPARQFGDSDADARRRFSYAQQLRAGERHLVLHWRDMVSAQARESCTTAVVETAQKR